MHIDFLERTVISIGNLVADIVAYPVDEVPRYESFHVETVAFHPGGCAGNTAVGLAKLGVPVHLVGCLGDDHFAHTLQHIWIDHGVDLRAVQRIPGTTTSVSIVLVGREGERRFIHGYGANAYLTPAALTPELLQTAGWLHVGGFFALPGLEDGTFVSHLAAARAQGITVSLDMVGEAAGRKRDILTPLLPHIDYLLLNHDEGRKVTGHHEPAAIAQALHHLGGHTVVVKLGPDGCYVVHPGGAFHLPTPQVPVRDTTGAGDAFAAGFVAALRRGDDLLEALRWANAAGTCSVTAIGATAGWEGWDDLRRLRTDLEISP